jgi:beta-lactamase superfamily II metal-dependent hydrolase
LWALCAACTLSAICCRDAGRARRLLRSAAFAAGLGLLPWTAAPVRRELVLLDVGHGTCAALREPDGSAWVFDAGSRDRSGLARGALGPLLASWDVGALRCALSHPERDHDSAWEWLLERHPPLLRAGADPAHPGERPAHSPARADLSRRGAIELGGQAGVRVWLLRGSAAEGNEGSRTLVLEHPEGLLWLSGDAVEDGLQGLLEAWPGPPGGVRVLLLPHHGGESMRLGAILDRLQPAEVWISSSEAPAALPELCRRRIPVRWTARDGPLVLDGRGP